MQHVTLNFSGPTSADVLAQVRAFALDNAADLSKFQTEDLLAEIRQRFASQEPAMVVRVLPFAEEGEGNGGSPVPTETKARRGRKPAQTPAVEAGTVAEQTPATGPELVVSNEAPTPAEVEAETVAASTSIDDVRAALNAYAAVHGQAKARELMQKEGGALVLMQVPSEKYGALITALRNGTPATQAAA